MASDSPRPQSRPLSPHLTIWRWGPHMLVSILHRVTGAALSTAGLALLVWWLMAIAGGKDAYDALLRAMSASVFELFGTETPSQGIVRFVLDIAPLMVILIGLTWAFCQHLLSGVRHLVTDSGAGFELQTNKRSAVLTMAGSLVLTLLIWVPALGVRP